MGKLIREPDYAPMAPAYVLADRCFKRATAHIRNIASSYVQPLHKIDFTSKIVALSQGPPGSMDSVFRPTRPGHFRPALAVNSQPRLVQHAPDL